MPTSVWFFHDAASGVSGTLPGAATQSTTAPGVTASGASTNKTMNGTKGTAQVAPTLTSLASTSRQNNWFRRFISPALAAQTVPAGTTSLWNIWIGASASNSSGGWSCTRGCIYVWRPSTGALVGKIMDLPTSTGTPSAVSTSEVIAAAGAFNGTADVVCQDGDVLVCEVWGGGTQGMATAYTWTLGYDGTTDTGGSGGSGTGTAIASAASCMQSPPLLLLGEGTPVSGGADVNVGSANETAYVEVSDFPQNAVIDNFNRADGILTSPWVGMTVPTQTYLTPYVSSNQASTGPPGNGCGAYRSDQSVTDCEAYIDLPNPAETQYHDVWLRFTGGTDINSQNGYYLRHDSVGNKLMLQKCSGGATSSVGGQPTCVASPGDSIGARVLGTTFSLYYKPLGAAKWRILVTGVDATYQNAGSTGFFSPGHPALFDNFGGGGITTPKSDTDTNGATTESGSYKGQYSDQDNTGINEIETPVLVGKLSDVDATGINEIEVTLLVSPVTDVDATGINEIETATATPATQISASDTNGSTTESASAVSFPQTGLIIHFDASTLGLSDGAAVNPWPNIATPGIPGTIVGSPSPIAKLGMINDGKGVVRFSALAGRVRMSSTGVSTPMTMLIVARMWSSTVGNNQRIVSSNVTAGMNMLIGWWGPAGAAGYQDTVYDGAWYSGEPSVAATTAWKLYSADQVGANPIRLFSDGVQVRTGGSGSQNFAGYFHLSGQDATGTQETSDCEVAEVFLYNRQLSDAERQQCENYLRNKWFKNAPFSADSNVSVSETTSNVVITTGDTNGAVVESAGYQVNVVVYEPDFVGTYNMLQSLYSPYSTIPTSFGTYDAIGGAPLPLPVLTENAFYQVNVPVSDINGSTTESAAFFYAPADSDSGTALEQASPRVGASSSDSNGSTTDIAVLTSVPVSTDGNGTTTESASITRVILSDTDNAGFTAAQALTAQLPVSDAGSIADSASVFQALVPVSSSDTNGTTTETQSYTYALSASDANSSLSETASFQPSYVGTDFGTTVESASVVRGLITTTDNFSSIEAATTGVPLYNGDTGSATDSATVVTQIGATDSGSAIETGIGSLTSSFIGTDQNSAVTESAAIAQTVSDSGSGSDSATPRFLIAVTDSGTASSESQSLATLNQKTDADFGGTPVEAVQLTASLTPGGDTASATESASASIYLYASDAGVGIDSSNLPVARIFDTDLGIGSDIGSAVVRITVADALAAYEMAAVLFGAVDTATGYDDYRLAAALTSVDTGNGTEAYDRYPPLTLFPEIPAGVILSMAAGQIVNASSVGTFRSNQNVRGTVTRSARGRILH